MTKQNEKQGLAVVDLERIAKDAVNKVVKDSGVLAEAFVAEPKPFKQVSELVSQKLKDSHRALYTDYVSAFNDVSAKLDSVDRDNVSATGCPYRSLRIDEVRNINAVWLHELYFANCFDPHSEIRMDTKAFMRLERDFGTFNDWQLDFMASAESCGQGWAITGYNMFLRRYVNTFVKDNDSNVMVGLYPIIVLDMHEHAYSRDYLSDKRSFIVSQMKEFNWDVIEERFLKAESIGEALK